MGESDGSGSNESSGSKEILQSLAPHPYQSLNADGEIIAVNDAWLDCLGYDRDDVLGRWFGDILTDESQIKFEAQFDKFKSNGRVSNIEFKITSGDDGVIIVLFDGLIEYDDQQNIVRTHCQFTDITEKKEREYELERYEAAIEGSTDLLMAVDRDRQILFANDRYRELVGLPNEELHGRHLRDVVGEDTFSEIDPRFERVLAGESVQYVREQTTADGDTRILDVQYYPLREGTGDEITGVVAALRDATEREQRKRQLRRYKQAVDAAGHAIYMTDADGEITYANQAFEDITGYAPSDAIGQNPRLLQSGEMPDSYYAELWKTVTNGEIWEEEVLNKRKNGELYHAEQTIAPVTDEDDNIEAYVAIQTDISDRKERLTEIKRLSEFQRILSEVNKRLVANRAKSDTLSRIVEILAESDLFECTFLSELDSQSVDFTCESGSNMDRQSVESFHTAAYIDAVTEDGALHIDDVTTPPFEQHVDDVPAHEGYAVELSHAGNSYGILTVHLSPGESPRDEERQLLDELAGDIGLFLHARQTETEREMFAEIVQRLDDPVMFQDRAGMFQVINDAVAEYANRPRDALLGDNEFTFMDDRAARIVAEQKQRVLDTEQPHTYELKTTFPEKGERVFKTTRYPHYDTDGSVDGTVAICRDVTDLKDREDHLEVFDRVLRHNIRNNMNTVLGQAEWVRENPHMDHEQAAQRILDAGTDLVELAHNERQIVELLTKSQRIRPVALGVILERIRDSITDQYPDSKVNLDSTPEVTVQAIPEIEDAIYELVENGIKHHAKGPPHVRLSVHEEADSILVRVEDDGPGIPDMEQRVLLDEHDITPLLHGSGLGLWLVKHIVTQSGGQLAFDENDPKGSIVELRFPVSRVE